MNIAFYNAKYGTFLDKLIAWWTRPNFWNIFVSGQFSHVEINFEEKLCYSSRPFEGTGWKRIESLNSEKWEIININISEYQKKEILTKCELQEGKKYDYFCIFFSFVLNFDFENPQKWTCSEFVAKNVFNLPYSHRYSPNKLFKYINKIKVN